LAGSQVLDLRKSADSKSNLAPDNADTSGSCATAPTSHSSGSGGSSTGSGSAAAAATALTTDKGRRGSTQTSQRHETGPILPSRKVDEGSRLRSGAKSRRAAAGRGSVKVGSRRCTKLSDPKTGHIPTTAQRRLTPAPHSQGLFIVLSGGRQLAGGCCCKSPAGRRRCRRRWSS